jgi:hypothetical protein
MRAEKVLGCELLLISHAGVIRMVGTVEGIRKHEGGRLGIEGTPMSDHPLIGAYDPLDNSSQNPVAYGNVVLPLGTDYEAPAARPDIKGRLLE